MKRRSLKGRSAKKRSDSASSYAAKQGRSRGKDGKTHGRTRYADTSPLSEHHRTDWSHRLAQVCLTALAQAQAADRASALRRAG